MKFLKEMEGSVRLLCFFQMLFFSFSKGFENLNPPQNNISIPPSPRNGCVAFVNDGEGNTIELYVILLENMVILSQLYFLNVRFCVGMFVVWTICDECFLWLVIVLILILHCPTHMQPTNVCES